MVGLRDQPEAAMAWQYFIWVRSVRLYHLERRSTPCPGGKWKQAQRKGNIFTLSQNSIVSCFQQFQM